MSRSAVPAPHRWLPGSSALPDHQRTPSPSSRTWIHPHDDEAVAGQLLSDRGQQQRRETAGREQHRIRRMSAATAASGIACERMAATSSPRTRRPVPTPRAGKVRTRRPAAARPGTRRTRPAHGGPPGLPRRSRCGPGRPSRRTPCPPNVVQWAPARVPSGGRFSRQHRSSLWP